MGCTSRGRILNLKQSRKSQFNTKKSDETFKKVISNIKGGEVSFDELRSQITHDYPMMNTDLISIPSTQLVKHKKYDYSYTEEDIKEHIKRKVDEATQNKESLRSPENVEVIENTFNAFKGKRIDKGEAVKNLKNIFLNLVFVGDNNPLKCKRCK